MIGTEYLYLVEGDQCILLEDIKTNNLRWNKGDIVEVKYRNRFEETIYFSNKNVQYRDRPSYKALGVLFCVKAMKLYKKFNQKPITKTTFEHKFNVGDIIWRMDCNEPKGNKIKRIEYIEEEKGKGSWNYVCNALEGELIVDDNCKIYGSKDELLDSLR